MIVIISFINFVKFTIANIAITKYITIAIIDVAGFLLLTMLTF